jgi:DNA-3-methyladenine glycosylase
LFRQGGYAYVYHIYGLYDCFNVVTEEEGIGSCVLVRAAKPVSGLAWMWAKRFPGLPCTSSRFPQLLSGPGRLCAGLGITKKQHNGISLLTGELTICTNPADPPPQVAASHRIGITKARERLWRFTIAGSPYLSLTP